MLGNKEIMANNIRRLMKENNVNATDVCTALGIKHNTFSDWVNAKSYPRIDKIEMMANYFRVKKSELVDDYELIQNLEYEKFSNELDVYSNFGYDAYQIIDIFGQLQPQTISEILNFAKYQYSLRKGEQYSPLSEEEVQMRLWGVSTL